ncbi:LysE family translocator [Capnocytophaga canimorsus]|nr:LysE family transporter [Capnocytophaga canimorsus]WGU68999.1 LysE family transporter [Capnocytophaga canimorsus]WGU69895.1 LysE family transporter [Capnocytophaga canimorsus]CEN51592.1 putative amino acid efflux protein ycgF [Capnocytophaga canimorsus]VEJ19537.1 homoserine/Threonine efflux protein [Capnocytophaga canimorsus]
MLHDILVALPLGLILAFTIGPVFFVLLETAITKGFRMAMVFDFGVILADIFFILIAYFTTSNLLEKIKDDPRLFMFGGIIMIFYGLFSFIKEKKDFNKQRRIKEQGKEISFEVKKNYFSTFVKGFLLNFINIGVLGFWLGIIIVFAPRLDMDTYRISVFFSAIILSYFLVDCLKMFLAKQLKNKLTAFHIHKIKRIISIVLLVFGVLLFLQGIFPESKETIGEQLNKFEIFN